MLLQAFVLARWNECAAAKKKCPTLMLGLKRASTHHNGPAGHYRAATTRGGGDDMAKCYTSGQLCSPPSVQTVPAAAAVSLLPHSLEIQKVSRDGSRVLCRTAGVELSRRRAGCCDCSSPPAVPWCRQVGAGTPAFLPPTNRMSQTDTRTQGDERRGLVKFGARGEKCKIVWAQRAKLQKQKNDTHKAISAIDKV